MPSLTEKPKIAVVGTGAVGGFYGGLLARAGGDVHFLFRSDYAAVRKNGLAIIMPDGKDLRLTVNAYHDTRDIGPCDLVIVAAKATANPALPPVVAPLLGAETALLTLQNGLGNAEFFAENFGAGRVMGGLCFICLNRVAPGVIKSFVPGYLSIGEFQGPPVERTRQLVGMFERAGLEKVILSESLGEALWRKLFWNVPFNGLAIAAGGVTTDQILANPELNREARLLMEEIQAAAKARGHDIPDSFIERQFRVTAPMGAYKPSSLIDFQEGRPVELEAIWGEPFRQGQAQGLLMPRLENLYRQLQAALSKQRKPVIPN